MQFKKIDIHNLIDGFLFKERQSAVKACKHRLNDEDENKNRWEVYGFGMSSVTKYGEIGMKSA